MRKIISSIFIFYFCVLNNIFAFQPQFSTAGFYKLNSSGRDAYSMNIAWRFFKGNVQNAFQLTFDDSSWELISLPNGIEYLPTNASGGVNYQGVVWYRKHFSINDSLKEKKLFLHFEAIMGKSKIWINGKLAAEHYGGYLPIIIDASNYLKFNQENVIAVMADNSNDPLYPPGKPQGLLDFAYFGGIYRDCWLVAHNNIYITDPNYENTTAGGGQFIWYKNISDKNATVHIKTQIKNERSSNFKGYIKYTLTNKQGKKVISKKEKISIQKANLSDSEISFDLKSPNLWSPESPYLYQLKTEIFTGNGKIIDGYIRRIGIKNVEFRQKDGLWLNGKPYPTALVGANRHQDYAIVGNVVSNNIHWLDAYKLRNAGFKIIRNAHYPQDPAFMDACDELGLFVIVNTPGWQFWNDSIVFRQRIYSDIKNMIRRDRNHASLFLWEPILNETHYPDYFAKEATQVVNEEFPYPGNNAACDDGAPGSEYFNILLRPKPTLDSTKTYFVREWGDNVDDWNAQNSNSRVSRAWGEIPMLIQAQHYAKEEGAICLDELYKNPRIIVGGCLWHSFDHQRGYHPTPFLGGTMDIFRQPKYSYYMFMSQRENKKDTTSLTETGPLVYIANEMTPFSPKDVTVYSNCDEVRLTFLKNGKVKTYKRNKVEKGMPSPVITFSDMYDFMACRAKARARKQNEVYLFAEGIINGEVVATHKVIPSGKPYKIVLTMDNNMNLRANGSDFVTIIASIADKDGNIKRLYNNKIKFDIEGEGTILGGENPDINPREIVWGTAPILVQSTTKSGKIKITASLILEGENTPLSGELEITSIKADTPEIYSQSELIFLEKKITKEEKSNKENLENQEKIKLQNELKLKEVEKQQTKFGVGIN